MDLARQLAVVTGATEGIGRAIAFALGRAGARVAVCARTEATVRATVDALRGDGVEAFGAACDVGDADAVARFTAFVAREGGDTRVLVNNAGIARFAPIEQLALDDWETVMATNVRSLFLMTRALLPGMKRAGGGTIVNIASLAGRNGIEHGTAYCASKHAVLGFSKALMLEVRKHQVRVVAVCPGSVGTALLGAIPRGAGAARDRILAPDDVAETVLATLTLPERAMVSELDIRPTNP
jgi:3-oxoacyl-[acyl-carrier protein] reductase